MEYIKQNVKIVTNSKIYQNSVQKHLFHLRYEKIEKPSYAHYVLENNHSIAQMKDIN